MINKEKTVLSLIDDIHTHYYFNYLFGANTNAESMSKITTAKFQLHQKLPLVAYAIILTLVVIAKIRSYDVVQKVEGKLREAKVYIKNLINPHNQIRIKKLNRDWHDTDCKMFHAVMQLVVDFVEKEHPYGKDFSRGAMRKFMEEFITEFEIFKNEHGSGEALKRQKNISLQIIDIYEWYKYDFEREEAMVFRAKLSSSNIILDEPYDDVDESNDDIECFVDSNHEEKLERKKTIMLYKAIKLRGSMWT